MCSRESHVNFQADPYREYSPLSAAWFSPLTRTSFSNMHHCIGILIEPLIALFTIGTDVIAICLDGCLQTCRESCRCISCCNRSLCNSSYHDDEQAQPILEPSQRTAQPQATADGAPRWSSVRMLREDSARC